MKLKNLSSVNLEFPGGRIMLPGEVEDVPDADWASLQHNPIVARWIARGILELNGAIVDPGPPQAPEGGFFGRVVVLPDQAAFDAISNPRSDTLYVLPDRSFVGPELREANRPRRITGNYQAVPGDFLFIDASVGPISLTLPAPTAGGKPIRIMTDGCGTNNLTIVGNVQGFTGNALVTYDDEWTLLPAGGMWKPLGKPILLPEVVALRKRMFVKPDNDRLLLINSAVSTMKALGLWGKIGWLSFLAAHDEQAARLNWVNPQQILSAGATIPQWIRDYGFKCDGQSSSLTTNVALNALPNFSQNDACMGVYVPDNSGAASGVEFGTSNSFIAALQTASVVARGNHSTSGQTLALAPATGFGWSYWSRKAADRYSIGRNLGAPAEKMVASTALDASVIQVGRVGTSQTAFSSKPMGLVVAGRMSPEEMQTFYTSVIVPYMTALGVPVP